MLLVTVAPMNRDPLLMHTRKFLSCFALWVLRLQGYSQMDLYGILEQLFCLPFIFGEGHHTLVRCVDRCIAIAFVLSMAHLPDAS